MFIRRFALVSMFAVAVIAFVMAGPAFAGKPTIMKGCKACHNAKPNVVRGKLVNFSPKFNSIQVDVGPVVWILAYDGRTDFKGTGGMAEVPKGKEMSVTFTGSEDHPLATEVSIKPAFEVPKEKQVAAEEMQELVLGGLKDTTLIDSRPPDAYASGHLPGAMNLPYPKLNKMREKALPADKNAHIVFYCGGFA